MRFERRKCKYCIHCMNLDFIKDLVDPADIGDLEFLVSKYGWCKEFWSLVLKERRACKHFEDAG